MEMKGKIMSKAACRIVAVWFMGILIAGVGGILVLSAQQKELIQYVETGNGRWMVHDENRPAPPVITPGICSSQEAPAKPPSDAIVLFDGRDLSGWTDVKGQPAKWVVRDGYMEAVPGAGYVRTRQEFGSCQVHVEFATPPVATGTSQGRGNSGVFLQGNYEVQVLDSYENK